MRFLSRVIREPQSKVTEIIAPCGSGVIIVMVFFQQAKLGNASRIRDALKIIDGGGVQRCLLFRFKVKVGPSVERSEEVADAKGAEIARADALRHRPRGASMSTYGSPHWLCRLCSFVGALQCGMLYVFAQ